MFLNTLICAVTALLLISSCHKDDSPAPPHTRLIVKLADSPHHYETVYLHINRIWTRTSSGSGKVEISSGPIDMDLEQKDSTIAAGDVPAGQVQEFILELADGGNEIRVDGAPYPLKIEGGKYVSFEVGEGQLAVDQTNVLLLHIDLPASIKTTDTGEFLIKPVVNSTLTPSGMDSANLHF